MNFVWGTLCIVIGIALMRYTFQVTTMFGRVDWAERNLSSGMGGTFTLWRLVGLGLVLIGLIYMFGSIGFLVSPLAPVFGGK